MSFPNLVFRNLRAKSIQNDLSCNYQSEIQTLGKSSRGFCAILRQFDIFDKIAKYKKSAYLIVYEAVESEDPTSDLASAHQVLLPIAALCYLA